MVYGVRDSWVLWGARRVASGLARAGTRAASGYSPSGGVRYAWKVSNVEIYQSRLNAMLKGSRGQVARFMGNVGDDIQTLAKRKVGVDTGNLRDSIYVKSRISGAERAVEVGSKLNYAYLHHEGTRPHFITPRTRTHLRFRAGARIVYTRIVLHPGTKPNRYLSIPMEIVVGSL